MRGVADFSDETTNAVERLRKQVLASPPLLDRLRATSGRQAFVSEVLLVAAELKLELTAVDVDRALRAARHECIEPWG